MRVQCTQTTDHTESGSSSGSKTELFALVGLHSQTVFLVSLKQQMRIIISFIGTAFSFVVKVVKIIRDNVCEGA